MINMQDNSYLGSRDIYFFVGVGVLLLIVVLSFLYDIPFLCAGEREFSEYAGVLEEIHIDCSQCCHASSYFKLQGKKPVQIFNCEEELNFIPLNKTYTFYLEPYPEPRGVTNGGCFWVQVIYRIVDEDHSVVWESRWW